MIRYDQRTETTTSIRMNLLAIDWILRRLIRLREAYPARAGELRPRLDSALDERLRLMRLRDAAPPFTKHTTETESHHEEPRTKNQELSHP